MTLRWTGFQSALGPPWRHFSRRNGPPDVASATTSRLSACSIGFWASSAIEGIGDITLGRHRRVSGLASTCAAQSYNQFAGIVTRLFDWLLAHGVVARSPVHAKARRTTAFRLPFLFDPATARRLLDAAGALPDTQNTRLRGSTYRTIFALLCGFGLRVGEVARLRAHQRCGSAAAGGRRARHKIREKSIGALRAAHGADR